MPVGLILFAVLLVLPGVVMVIPSGAQVHWGVNHFVAAAEPIGDFAASLPSPFPTAGSAFLPAAVGTVLLISKARRSGDFPLPVHRLSLPFRRSSRSLPPD